MFNFFKKKSVGSTITLKLSGLHCVACSLNIDNELEELPGVLSTKTSYTKQVSVITYDPSIISPTQFTTTIESLGYKVI